ncbi:MAG: CapA family protein [Anaerolineales bacterium]|nr:CapA family protein [Anaerolineales bacterium]
MGRGRTRTNAETVYWLLVTGYWLLVLAGCGADALPGAETAVSPTLIPTAQMVPTATPMPTATATLPPTAVPTQVPTTMPTITPVPTATDLPPITLAVPQEWVERVQTAISHHPGQRGWQIMTAAEAQAEVRLVNDDSGILLWREPLALAVPFTAPVEGVDLAKAQAIVAGTDQGDITLRLWRDMVPQLRALRVNGRFPPDLDYPLQASWSLLAPPELADTAEQLAAELRAGRENEPLVWLTAVGDIMLDRSLGYYLNLGNLAYPFADIADELKQADYTVGNMESALGSVGERASKSYTFRAPPQAAEALALAGFDLLTLANNHGMDFGPEALAQGLGLLHAQGLATVGAGANATTARQPHLATVNGLTLAFLGYVNVPVEARGFDTATWTATETAPGLAWGYPEVIAADVTAVRSQADVVIVLLHSGYEYQENPSPPQVAAAKAAIDAGADLVIGHHAHILQGVEFYNGGVIAYGLGNFAFEIDGSPETAVFHFWLDKNGVRQLAFTPAVIQFGGQPRLATAPEAFAIRQQIYRLTDRQ